MQPSYRLKIFSKSYHRRTKAIFAERSILKIMLLITGLQILLDRLTQYAIAFSMDKDNLLSVIKSVLIHHLTEFSQLVRQHIRIAQSIRIIQQFGYMQDRKSVV